jgi:HAE1 family hydrophobic/amphiphilic exporter-1
MRLTARSSTSATSLVVRWPSACQAAMEALSRKALPLGFAYEWTGLSLEELESAGTSVLLFGLGTLVVYLTLAAQYESFVLPFIVLMAAPMALLGAVAAQWLRGLQNDVYCQIGLVMLVGLASKNAILISSSRSSSASAG